MNRSCGRCERPPGPHNDQKPGRAPGGRADRYTTTTTPVAVPRDPVAAEDRRRGPLLGPLHDSEVAVQREPVDEGRHLRRRWRVLPARQPSMAHRLGCSHQWRRRPARCAHTETGYSIGQRSDILGVRASSSSTRRRSNARDLVANLVFHRCSSSRREGLHQEESSKGGFSQAACEEMPGHLSKTLTSNVSRGWRNQVEGRAAATRISTVRRASAEASHE